MKKLLRYIFLLLIIILTTVLSGYIYFKNDYPRLEKKDIKIDPTPRMFGIKVISGSAEV